jgi:hypothetical protein
MKTDPIQDYILKSEQNLRIAASVGEAWPDAREKLVSAFLDRLDTRLKRKLCRRKSLSKAATLGLNSPSGKSYEI